MKPPAREGEVGPLAFPSPDELWAAHLCLRPERLARPLRSRPPGEDQAPAATGAPTTTRTLAVDKRAGGDRRPVASRVLLTLATGTGKTFIAFQIAWKLFQSRWNLSDWTPEPNRRRARAVARASSSLPTATSSPTRPTTPSRPSPRMPGPHRPGRHPQEGQRCPRTAASSSPSSRPSCAAPAANPPPTSATTRPTSSTSSSSTSATAAGPTTKAPGAILEYFAPAVQLGLTATPKRKDNVDTYAYFGEPVFVYSLKDGINDGFLTPFKVRQIATTLDDYVYTPDDRDLQGEVEAGKRYTEKETSTGSSRSRNARPTG